MYLIQSLKCGNRVLWLALSCFALHWPCQFVALCVWLKSQSELLIRTHWGQLCQTHGKQSQWRSATDAQWRPNSVLQAASSRALKCTHSFTHPNRTCGTQSCAHRHSQTYAEYQVETCISSTTLLPSQTSGTKHSLPRKPHRACAECRSHLKLKQNESDHGSYDSHTHAG